MPRLDRAQVGAAMKALPAWRKIGSRIARTYAFKDFPTAIRFVNAVARVAERAGHHPDIAIRWNQVALTLTTHDAGGLTEKDFELAAKFDTLPKP
jgi:4a-hydroxytetrahydrobiopterin dehydratase